MRTNFFAAFGEDCGIRLLACDLSSSLFLEGATVAQEISSEISLERWRLVAFEKGNMNRGLSLSLVWLSYLVHFCEPFFSDYLPSGTVPLIRVHNALPTE